MKRNYFLLLMILLVILYSCEEKKNEKRGICTEKSIWRDKNGADSCSYFSKEESCKHLTGKLSILSRLHKHFIDKNVFEGGMSSRWFQISDDSISYFTPAGEIADRGACQCKNGVLTIDWEIGEGLPKKAEVYFNSPDFVELRYFDYPFSMNTFRFDTLKTPDNPTKMVGTISNKGFNLPSFP